MRCSFGEHLQGSENVSSGRQGQVDFPATQVTFHSRKELVQGTESSTN